MSKKRFFALVMTLAMLLTLFAPAFTFAAKNRDETPKPKTVYVGIVEHLDPDANWQNYTVHYWGDGIEAGDAELHDATAKKREYKNVGSWSDSQKFYIYTANIPAGATGYKVHNGETWYGGDGVVEKPHVYVFEYGNSNNAKYYQSSGMKVHGNGQTYYENLEDAFAHAETDGTRANFSLLSNQNAGSLVVDSNKNIQISLHEYNLTANIVVEGNLLLNGSGLFTGTITVRDGGTVTITSGTYSFDPSEYVPTGYDVVPNSNGTYTVQKHVEPFIYIKVSAGEGGRASADPTKIARADVGTAYSTLTATPDEGYVFDKWVINWGMTKPAFVDGDTVEDAVCRIIPTNDETTAQATFKAAPVGDHVLTLVTKGNAGTATLNPQEGNVAAGTPIKLTLTPVEAALGNFHPKVTFDPKIEFKASKEEEGGRVFYDFTMPEEDLTVTVDFGTVGEGHKLTVVVDPKEAATYKTFPEGQTVFYPGDTYRVSLYPVSGWTCVEFKVNGVAQENPSQYTNTKWEKEFGDEDITIYAKFENPNAEYTITYVDKPTEGGKVTGPKSATANTQVKGIDVEVNEGYKLDSLVITAADGSTIEHSGAETSEKFEFTMPDQNVTVTATYKKEATPAGYTAKINVTNGKGYVATTGTNTKQDTIYNVPKDAPVTAGFEGTDNTWLLKSARLNGTEIDRTKITVTEHVGAEDRTCYEYNFKMPEGDVTIDVEFAKEVVDHKLTLVTKGNAGTATLNPAAGNVAAGTPIKLTLTPVEAALGNFHPKVTFDPKIESKASKEAEGGRIYYDFVMPDEDLTVTVDFGTIGEGHKLTVIVDPEEAATYKTFPEGQTVFYPGDTYRVSLYPVSGWTCVEFKVNGVAQENPSQYTNTKWEKEFGDEDITIYARFENPNAEYDITYVNNPTAGGKVTGPKSATAGTQVKGIEVIPSKGYKLGSLVITAANGSNIEHSGAETGEKFEFTMPAQNVTVTANFIPDGEGKYTVTIDKDLGSCPAIRLEDGSYHSEYKFNEGNQVTIQTTPDKSHVLVHLWANGKEVQVDANGDYIFNMPAEDVLITAEYGLYFNKLIIEEADNGTVTSDQQKPESVAVNTQVTLTIKPDKAYVLGTLTVDGVDVTKDVEKDTYTFTMPAHDVTVTATFKMSAIPLLHTVNVEYINAGHGSAYLTFTNGGNHYDFPQTVAPDKTVFVGVDCEDGFREIVTIAADDGTEIERIENMKYGFIMPAADVTVTVKFVPMPHFWASHGLLLSTEIGVIFYVDFGDFTPDDYPGTYATFTVAGTDGEQKCFVDKTDYIQTGDGRKHYKTYCYVNSISMADKITPVLHVTYEGEEYDSEGQLYAVADYVAANYNSSNLNTKQKNLLKALADYGHYAQLYLKPLDEGKYGQHEDMQAYNYQSSYNFESIYTALEGKDIVRPADGIGDIEKVTFSLYTDSKTRIYLYAKMKQGATTTPTYQYGDASGEMQTTSTAGKYLYKGPSFMPTALDKMVDVVLGDGADATDTISVSVMSWVRLYIQNTENVARQNFCAALYYYNLTAKALVN